MIKIDTLDLSQLLQLKKSLEEQLNIFMNSFNGFRMLSNKYEDSKILVKNIKDQAKPGDSLLIPLSTSLYIPGKLKDTDHYLVDLGTGYFVEYSAEQTQSFC